MKHEWKKKEKQFYLPKTKPELVHLPTFKFFTIEGQGNPNHDFFADYIAALYTLSYTIKMSPKKGTQPVGYFDYAVYPLEGVWDLKEEARKEYKGDINKDDLVFKLMIRQPDFVDHNFAQQILEHAKIEKPNLPLLNEVKFEEIKEGQCVQILHLGSYDNEPETFKMMENFIEQEQYTRASLTHREIYLNDSRKVTPDKLKTVLRWRLEP